VAVIRPPWRGGRPAGQGSSRGAPAPAAGTFAPVAAILVTGMSGTGKSTVLAELARRGWQVVDTDQGGYSEERSPAPGDLPEQLWVEDRIDELLSRHEACGGGVLFLGGTVANQRLFRSRFAVVVLLSAPEQVLLDRLATRTTNGFGKSPADLARIAADLTAVQPLLRAGADVEIDTREPLEDVVDQLVRLAEGLAAGHGA
jgi:shikimate kinase